MISHRQDGCGLQNTRDGQFFKTGVVRIAAVAVLTATAAAGRCEPLGPAVTGPSARTARAVACLSSGDLHSAEAMQTRAVLILKRSAVTPELELAGAWNLLGVIQRRGG